MSSPKKAPASKVKKPATLTTPQIAALLMVTPRWVRQVSSEGWYGQAGRGRWDLTEVVQGYLKYLKDDARRSSQSAGESRVRTARAREIEVRTAEREGRLISMDDHFEIIDKLAATVRTRVQGWPARVTRDLHARRELEKQADALLNDIAKKLGEAARKLASAGSITDDKPENGG